MTAQDFWNRVKTLIKAQNTKQETVAVSCGISYRTFQTWINRKTYPDALQTYLIAKALNTSVEYLVTGENPTPSNPELLKAISEIKQIVDKTQLTP